MDRSALDWLRLAQRRLVRLNVTIDLGSPDAVAVLAAQGGEAVTIACDDGATVLFRDATPTSSAVLEELAHVMQHAHGSFADCDLREMLCRREIEAKECLVKRQAHYGISDVENEVTLQQVDMEQRTLGKLKERW